MEMTKAEVLALLEDPTVFAARYRTGTDMGVYLEAALREVGLSELPVGVVGQMGLSEDLAYACIVCETVDWLMLFILSSDFQTCFGHLRIKVTLKERREVEKYAVEHHLSWLLHACLIVCIVVVVCVAAVVGLADWLFNRHSIDIGGVLLTLVVPVGLIAIVCLPDKIVKYIKPKRFQKLLRRLVKSLGASESV